MDYRVSLVEYWKKCFCINAVLSLEDPLQFPHIECIEQGTDGPIVSPEQINKLTTDSSQLVFIPYFFKNEAGEILFPYLLFVNFTEQLLPDTKLSIPIVPKIAQEGMAVKEWVVTRQIDLVNCLQLNFPEFETFSPTTINQQVEFAEQVFSELNAHWSLELIDNGFQRQDHSLLLSVPVNELDAILNGPLAKNFIGRLCKQEWHVLEEDWIGDNSFTRAALLKSHGESWAFNVEQRQLIEHALDLKPGDWLTCQAGRATGKTAVIHSMVENEWLTAALEHRNPLIMGELTHHGVDSINLFLIDRKTNWLSATQCRQFYRNESAQNYAHLSEGFLENASKWFDRDITSLKQACEAFLHALNQEVYEFTKGVKLAHSYMEVINFLDKKYENEGGLAAKLAEAQKTLQEHHSHVRHLQVLQSLWDRQLNASLSYSLLNIMPLFKKKRLQRLYQFFADHLPEENVKGLSITQMEKKIDALLQRSLQRERSVHDLVLQLKTDERQLNIARQRFHDWLHKHDLHNKEQQKLNEELDTTFRHHIQQLSRHYWEAKLLLTAGWSNQDPFQVYFANLNNSETDWLFVEHAEEKSIIQILPALAKANRVIFLGQTERMTNLELSSALDFVVARNSQLIELDEQFEDLDYRGLTLSSHGMRLGQEFANYRPEFLSLTQQYQINQMLSHAQNALNFYKVENHSVAREGFIALNVTGQSSAYHGTLINTAEIEQIKQWIVNNKHSIEEQYSKPLAECLSVVCMTSGQAFRLKLELTDVSDVPIYITPTIPNNIKPITLFSPVFTQSDPRPFPFDEGTSLVCQMLCNTSEKFIFIGDKNLIIDNQHSAFGKIAQYFNKHEQFSQVVMQATTGIDETTPVKVSS